MDATPVPIRQFERFYVKGWTLWVHPAFPRDWMGQAAAAAALDDGVRGPFERLGSSRHTVVSRGRLVFHGRVFELFIKRFYHRSTIDFAKHLVRPSRAQRDAAGCEILRAHGLNAPTIVAIGERSVGPVCLESLTVTLHARGEHLYDYLQHTSEESPLWDVRRRLIMAVGRCVGRMHAAGIVHGDLRPRNVLVQPDGDRWQVTFLDNERTCRSERLSDAARLKNLVQINMFPTGLSRTDRMRFFRAYLDENPSLKPNARTWAARIMEATRRRLEGKPYGRDARL